MYQFAGEESLISRSGISLLIKPSAPIMEPIGLKLRDFIVGTKRPSKV
jgi:hypothetical protein